MAMSARYLNVAGEILSQERGGAERDYLPDPLGSTAALLDGAQAETARYEYWPYGEVRSRAGEEETPFDFVGTLGCRSEGDASSYMRRRTARRDLGRWLTADPLWPRLLAYMYGDDQPTTTVDPQGLRSTTGTLGPVCAALNEAVYGLCSSCYRHGPPSPDCQRRCDDAANAYYDACKGPRPPSEGWHPGGQAGIVPPPLPVQGPPKPPPWVLDPSWGSEPCYAPTWRMRQSDIETCEAAAGAHKPVHNPDGTWYTPFNLFACKACCERNTPPGYLVDQSCIATCNLDFWGSGVIPV